MKASHMVQALRVINQYWKEKGYGPTFKEIAIYIGSPGSPPSISQIHHWTTSLSNKLLITIKTRSSRTVRLTELGKQAIMCTDTEIIAFFQGDELPFHVEQDKISKILNFLSDYNPDIKFPSPQFVDGFDFCKENIERILKENKDNGNEDKNTQES